MDMECAGNLKESLWTYECNVDFLPVYLFLFCSFLIRRCAYKQSQMSSIMWIQLYF